MPSVFDGVDDEISFGDKSVFSFGDGSSDSSCSFSFWFKLNDTVQDPQTFISKWMPNTGNAEYLIRYFGTTIDVILEDESSGGRLRYTANIGLGDTLLHHIVVTYDGSSSANGITMYIDSTLDVPSLRTTGGTYVAMENLAAPLRFGSSTTGGGAEVPFNGILDEVIIYDVELTADQARALFNSISKEEGDSVLPSNRIIDVRMNEGDDGSSADGTTFVDYSGNGNDGIGNNGGNNTGMGWLAESFLNQPGSTVFIQEVVVAANVGSLFNAGLMERERLFQ